MAGTLVANTINTDTGLFSTQNAYQGIAKAWCSVSGSTPTVNASFNVSSVTVNSAADYTINFATAMVVDAYYTAAGFCNYDPIISGSGRYMSLASAANGSIRVWANYNYNALQTPYTCMVMVVGNG